MPARFLPILMAALLAAALPAQGRPVTPVAPATVAPRSPADQRAAFLLPPGYRIDCVAAEPLVREPVMAVFDGAGRLWVCEMRTYVQDVDGTGTDDPKSTIAVLTDDDGDGRFDRRTVYADGLVLPRMLLPLDATRTLYMETYDGVLWLGHDDDGDLVQDRRERVHEFGRSGANLEHQDSALVWGIDNWLYTAMGGQRLRFATDGSMQAEPVAKEFAQWGLAVDDLGRQFFSSAGGERPAYGFQQHPLYGKVTNDGALAPGFSEVFPALAIPDVQGGRGRLKDDGTLNHFTGCCGQVVHRGGALPADVVGDYLIAEPVGRLIRRAKIRRDGARVVLHNAYEAAEFVSSTDPNFRPVWLTDGPDGGLFVVDMYRGIIQESNWVREGSYLRPVAQELGLDANVGRGRIWRIRHDDHPRRDAEDLHRAPTARLCALLASDSGHVRDTAQRLLVLRGDATAIPRLKPLAAAFENALGRLHALWTLDGLGATDPELLIDRLADPDPRVRQTAIRIAEPLLADGHDALTRAVRERADDPALDVRIQVVQSLRYATDDASRDVVLDLLIEHADDPTFQAIGRTTLEHGADPDQGFDVTGFDTAALVRLRAGREHYRSLCIACHGPDGAGVAVPDSTLRLAPPLAGSRRLLESDDVAVRILLHGMTGTLDGVDYAGGLMAPVGAQDDEWIAAVLTFARNAFGNVGRPVGPETVARIRAATAGRTRPWLPADLERFRPVDADTLRGFTWTASHVHEPITNAFDGRPTTRFSTGTPMRPGMWLQVDFGEERWRVDRIVLDCRGSDGDYPRGYTVRVSGDGETWSDSGCTGVGTGPIVDADLPDVGPVRFVRIEQTGRTDGLWWSIHELQLYGQQIDR